MFVYHFMMKLHALFSPAIQPINAVICYWQNITKIWLVKLSTTLHEWNNLIPRNWELVRYIFCAKIQNSSYLKEWQICLNMDLSSRCYMVHLSVGAWNKIWNWPGRSLKVDGLLIGNTQHNFCPSNYNTLFSQNSNAIITGPTTPLICTKLSTIDYKVHLINFIRYIHTTQDNWEHIQITI